MSHDGSITLTWAGDERLFRLDIAGLLALQDACGAGPAEIAGRLMNGTWRVNDPREVLRLGLIGGGENGAKARKLVDDNAGPGQLANSALCAYVVVMAAIQGVEDDPVGKDEEVAPAPVETTPATDVSAQPPSSEPAQQ